jgi:EpsI family protein
MRERTRFAPALLLAVGCLLLLSVRAQRTLALQAPLTQLPDPLAGYGHVDVPVPDDQVAVAGMSNYVNRVYTRDSADVFGLYVGFYDSQQQGRTVHSPKNCLPGSGWEPMSARRDTISTGRGDPAQVNRYIIANKTQQAIVYYWYQGRGRVAANEYAVKWHLLRDAAIRRRTDEALVRIIVPVTPTMSVADADRLARDAARRLIPTLYQFLPA